MRISLYLIFLIYLQWAIAIPKEKRSSFKYVAKCAVTPVAKELGEMLICKHGPELVEKFTEDGSTTRKLGMKFVDSLVDESRAPS